MTRPRKATALLEMSGSIKKDPKRYANRADEPRPTSPIGDPPAEFLKETKEAQTKLRIWHEIIADAPDGVLTGCDRMMLANACRIQGAIEGGDYSAALLGQMRTYLGDMGMTPAGRSKVAAPKKQNGATNPWEEFAQLRT